LNITGGSKVKKNQKTWLKQAIILVLAFAVILGGGRFGKNAFAKQTKKIPQDNSAKTFFDSNGKLKTPFVTKKTTFRVLWQKFSADKGTMVDKAILTRAFKATGISWDVEQVSEIGWEEKLSVVFASGDLPDLICGQIKNLANYTNQCCDITKLLPKYAPYTANFIMKQYPGAAGAERYDGKIYSLPEIRINGCYTPLGLWHINSAWLKKLGLKAPTTTDQFYEVLKAFKAKDPNGNGKSDELPYSFVGILGHQGILNMMNCFGLINDGVNRSEQYIMVEKHKVIFTPTDKRFYNMLVYLHKLYAEGLIDPDSFVQKSSDLYTKTTDNRVGFLTSGGLPSTAWGGDSANHIEYIKPPASQYRAVLKQNDPPGELTPHVYTITKACKQPQLLIAFQEYLNSTADNRFESRFGPEGGAWYADSDGKAVNTKNFEGKPYSNRDQAIYTLSPAFNIASIITKSDEGRRLYTGSSLVYNNAVSAIYGPAGGIAYKECFPIGNDTMASSAARTEAFTEIDNYIKNFVARSVMNGINQSQWNAHLQSCNKLNVKKYAASFQSLYNRLKKK
jgi:putative aldouronate transport system substrate-binding protein